MKKPKFTASLIFAAIVLLGAGFVSAQEEEKGTKTQEQPAVISPERRALINEIRELTGMSKYRVGQKFSSATVGDVFSPMIDKDSELTEEQKQDLRKFAAESKIRLEQKLRDYTEDTTRSAKIFEDVFIQLYDKDFTDGELQEMVAFYRTPAGQKSAKFLAVFVEKWSKRFSEVFAEELKQFVGSQITEELDMLRQKIKEAKTKKLEAGISEKLKVKS